MAKVIIRRAWYTNSEGFEELRSGSFRAYVSVGTIMYLINFTPIEWPGTNALRGIPIAMSHTTTLDETYLGKNKTPEGIFNHWGEDGWIYRGDDFSTSGFRDCLNDFIRYHAGDIEEAWNTDEPAEYLNLRYNGFTPLPVKEIYRYPGENYDRGLGIG